MKKIETLIDNCINCPSCGVYKRSRKQEWGQIAVCHEYDRVLFLASDTISLNDLSIPDWCPLETYKEAEKSEAKLTAPADNCSTIILPGMPSLEWMTENLSGHGGTEINGNWYYTYDQAMAAAKELGDGWRLPTHEEFEKLCDLGSTWDEKRKGRWFGGNHDTDHGGRLFLPAAGCLLYSSGVVTFVGAHGGYWSSSPYSTEVYAGVLYFSSGGVLPVDYRSRALGFSVRCVREISKR